MDVEGSTQQLLDADVIGSAELQRRQAELAQAEAEVNAALDQLKVLGMSAVSGLHRERHRVRVLTTRGEVSAGEVVVATNGYTSGATPEFNARIVSPGSAIIATEPLPAGLMDRLLPRRRVMGETRRVFNYYRASPDGERIVFGLPMQPRARAEAARPAAHPECARILQRLSLGEMGPDLLAQLKTLKCQ